MTYTTGPNELAIFGGQPEVDFPIPDWPGVMPDVIQNVQRALRDGSWGRYHAEWTDELIQALSQRFEQPFVTLCCSGTFAVELALRAAGVEPGREVILAGYDFPGNFRAIESIGARPVLVDVIAGGWTIDAEQTREAITPDTAAIIMSHLHGQLADVQSIRPLADTNHFVLVEDACQVPGALIASRPAGSYGHVSVLSFGGSKLLTAGRGGAVLTSDPKINQRLKVFADRGNDAFPMSQLQAAALVPQLGQLTAATFLRNQNAAVLASQLAGCPGLVAAHRNKESRDEPSAWYKFPLLLDPVTQDRRLRADYIAAMQAEGLPVDEGFRGFSLRSSRRCRKLGELPNSQLAASQTILLHHPVLQLENSQLLRVANAIQKVCRAFSDGNDSA